MACVINVNFDDLGKGGAREIEGTLKIGTTTVDTPLNLGNFFKAASTVHVHCGSFENLRIFHNKGAADVGGLRIQYSNGTNVPASVDLSGVNISFSAKGWPR